ncbi:phosphate acetyltransferase [Amaricoccus macauensis]|uniref:phosphate acetyltransferase n=1 Tax=Amaricoccus macauensis TaxID=57001 RepID=UPI003C7CCD2F
MKPLQRILDTAARSDRRIALPEGEDPRVVEAAVAAARGGIARITLLGDAATIRSRLASAGGEESERIEIRDPAASPITGRLAELYLRLRAHKGLTETEALEGARAPAIHAALSVRAGLADGTLGGATLPTAVIVRTAIQIIGMAPESRMVSSFFLMMCCASHHAKNGAYVFADAGLVIDPTADEMAEIAIASARSYAELTGEVPRVAMLSFSTHGSAQHGAVSKVVEATAIAKARCRNLIIDGELQFDAAFVPDVAFAKAKGSPLGGDANVFVFPSLEAGNIGYKIAQRLGGAEAIGPILQGLAKPANDLSRGCSAEDVLHMIAVTAAQADGMAEPIARMPELATEISPK